MLEFIQACFTLVNLPWTIMFLLMACYWSTVIIGLLDIHAFDIDVDASPDIDVDVDVDVDAQLDVDTEVSADLDGHADMETDVDADHDVDTHSHADVGSGWGMALLKFMNVGQVPSMVLLSVLVVSVWAGSVLSNHYLNPQYQFGWAALLLVPNLVVSLFITKLATWPFRFVFSRMQNEAIGLTRLIGKTCVVTTSQVNPQFGQAEIITSGAPLLIHVRADAQQQLTKGDQAVVVQYDPEKLAYQIVKVNWEE